MSFPSYQLRPAQPDDAEGIAAAHVAAWKIAYRGLVEDEYLNTLAIGEKAQSWRKWIEQGQTKIIAAIDPANRVAGFVAFGKARTIFLGARGRLNPYSGEIYAIYLQPDVWRQGLGRRLLSAGAQGLIEMGHEGGALWTLEKNRRAIAFYRSMEGQALGKHKITIGTSILTELGFGWPELQKLVALGAIAPTSPAGQ